MQQITPILSKFKFQDLSPIQSTILLLHSCNLFHQLKPVISQNDMTQCEIPPDWVKDIEGVYSFTYKLGNGKRVLFKFVESENRKAVGVNMVVEETGVLSQVSIDVETDDKLKAEKYREFLATKLNSKKKEGLMPRPLITSTMLDFRRRSSPSDRVSPVRLQPVPLQVGPNLGGEEYVGPNSRIFNDRFGNNPVDIRGAPYGARYDPTDPFDPLGPGRIGGGSGLQGIGGRGTDFFSGFDEFGAPVRGGFGGFGPGNNGLGGGFGGGFGGGSNPNPRW